VHLKRSAFALVAVMFSFTIAPAEWFEVAGGQGPIVTTVAAGGPLSTTIDIKVPGIDLAPIQVDTMEFDCLRIPGCHTLESWEGRPELPRLSFLLAIPGDASPLVTVTTKSTVRFDGIRIYPLQPHADSSDSVSSFEFDREFYATCTNYPDEEVMAGAPAIWRDVRVVRVEIRPVRAVPAEAAIEVTSHLTVRVDHPGLVLPTAVASWMRPLYGRLVDNSEWLWPLPLRDSGGVARCLIVLGDAFRVSSVLSDTLCPWLERRGYDIDTIWAGGSSPVQIKQRLVAAYLDSLKPPLRWVFLVGSHRVVPAHTFCRSRWGSAAVHGSDYWYSDLMPDTCDDFPEVGIARLPLDDTANLGACVRKLMHYEECPPTATDWLDRLTLVAHRGVEERFKPLIESLAVALDRGDWGFYQPQHVQLAGKDLGIGNDIVASNLNAGVGALLYAGHGKIDKWDHWTSTADQRGYYDWLYNVHVPALTNGEMTPFVFNVACSTAAPDTSALDMSSLSETWVTKVPGGAVASLGATKNTIGTSNRALCSTYVRSFCDDWEDRPLPPEYQGPVFDVGGMKMLADAYLATFWPDDLQGATNLHSRSIYSYLFHGAPFTAIWAGGVPVVATVVHPASLRPGSSSFGVIVSLGQRAVQGARVSLWQSGEGHLAVGATDRYGGVSFSVSIEDTASVTITVAGGHAATYPHTPILPYHASIPVAEPGWAEVESMPRLLSGRAVKDGGWLTFCAGNGLVYAAKGNSTVDFGSYNPSTNAWSLEPADVPLGLENKRPKAGCQGVCDGSTFVYMTKGNNTRSFWRYDVEGNVWEALAPLDLGRANRGLKNGTCITYVVQGDSGFVYLAKGYTREFYRYSVLENVWQALPDVPTQGNVKSGAWLVWDGDSSLYYHTGKYREFRRFNVTSRQWSDDQLNPMPLDNGSGRQKKTGAGGCACWHQGRIVALKGGNTVEAWEYCPVQGTWRALDTVPLVSSAGRLRRVNGGGSMAVVPGLGLLALKGNKTVELWRYNPAAESLDRMTPPPAQAAEVAAVPRKSASGGGGLDGENPLADGFEACSPRWSPNGLWIAYSRDDSIGFSQVWMSLLGLSGTEVQVTTGRTDCEYPVFSPDGQWLAFHAFDTVSERTQLYRVQASASHPPAEQLTSDDCDHERPEWSPDGQWLVYQKDDASDYSQLYRMPSGGGEELAITTGEADHKEPKWLGQDFVSCLYSPDDGYDQIARVNVNSGELLPLTSSEADHSAPDPSWLGTDVAFEYLDKDGTFQIGTVPAGGGAENLLTSGVLDHTAPDWSPDGFSIYCARWPGEGSEIGWVDVLSGGFSPLTDATALRDNPDVYYQSILCSNAVAYERESLSPTLGDGPRRRTGTGIWFLRHRRRTDGGQTAGTLQFALERAEPNPVRSGMTIHWQVPTRQPVNLRVYNTAGRVVRVLEEGERMPGRYSTRWNGRDDVGRRLAAGVYFCALEAGERRSSRKVVLAE
jgi:TolB protein